MGLMFAVRPDTGPVHRALRDNTGCGLPFGPGVNVTQREDLVPVTCLECHKPWLCEACAKGDHGSHDGRGEPWDGTSRHLDAFDCKVLRDRDTQCMCRANWPRQE